jgi:hypothetical protein
MVIRFKGYFELGVVGAPVIPALRRLMPEDAKF